MQKVLDTTTVIEFIIYMSINSRKDISRWKRILPPAAGIVEKVMSFLLLISYPMLSTVSALGAQNIGANKLERAIQTLRYTILLALTKSMSFKIAVTPSFTRCLSFLINT